MYLWVYVDEGEKKVKKQNILLKRLYANSNKNMIPKTSPKENKYPTTRGKTRTQELQESSNN